MGYLVYQFTVEPPEPGTDILIAMISEMGFESFEQNSSGFRAYLNEDQNELPDFSELNFEDFSYSFQVEKIETKNWNAEWEKNFDSVVVDDLLCIRAPFHPHNDRVKLEIVIMPKMSFGTGHHQTTRLMCKQIFGLELHDKRVLDMGCGTGVLAILAEKLGAYEVLGIDIDEWSVENAFENAVANNCNKVVIRKGDIDQLEVEKPFQVILANINKNILKKHLPMYAKKLESGGILLLSGFFITDVEELKNSAAAYQLDFVTSTYENEWAMIELTKN